MSFFARLFKKQKVDSEESFGLDQLDLKLLPYVDFCGGFFIEAGANDGMRQSNTLYFEKYRQWRGILIEPLPEAARRCRKNRPNCIVEQCALVPFDYPKSVVEMRYCNLMSLVKGAMKSEAEELSHIKWGCDIQKLKSYELTVPARTLTNVLTQHAVSKVDFFSLDVEGYELSALQGLDFEQYRPTLILVEARYRQEIDDFLRSRYEPIAELSHHDVLYRSLTA